MRSAKLAWCLVAIAWVGIASAAGSAEPAPLRIAGSTTLFPVAENWVAGFSQRHSEPPVSLEAGGTTAGVAALVDGSADLALASRPIREGEHIRAAERGFRLETIEVARDALSVLVHRQNPIATLSREQLRGLFTGELTRWDQVGGPPRLVALVIRNRESHTGQYFRQQVLAHQAFAEGGVVTSNRDEMVAEIAASPWAIGFAGLADATNSELRELVKPVQIQLDPGEPEHGSAGRSVYAISRPLFFVARSPLSPPVERFVKFVLSPEGQALIVGSNFFPIDASASPAGR